MENGTIQWNWDVKLPRELQYPVRLASLKKGKQIRQYITDVLKEQLKKDDEQAE